MSKRVRFWLFGSSKGDSGSPGVGPRGDARRGGAGHCTGQAQRVRPKANAAGAVGN